MTVLAFSYVEKKRPAATVSMCVQRGWAWVGAIPAGSVARTTLPIPWYKPLGASAFRLEVPYSER